MRNVVGKIFKKIKTHVLYSIPFFSENLTDNEIMWKNSVKPDRPQMVIRRMNFACYMSKATDTQSKYEIRFAIHNNNGYANAPRCNVYSYIVPFANFDN